MILVRYRVVFPSELGRHYITQGTTSRERAEEVVRRNREYYPDAYLEEVREEVKADDRHSA